MKARFAVSILGIAALALSGCSSDSDSGTDKDPTTTTEAADSAVDRDLAEFTAAINLDETAINAECMAESAIGSISDEGYQQVLDDADFNDYSEDDREVMRTAVNECVAHADFVDQFLDSMAADVPDLNVTDDQRSCMIDFVESEFGTTGDLMVTMNASDSDEDYAALMTGTFGCLGDEASTSLLTSLFADEGLTPEQTACVVAAVSAEYSPTELLVGLMGMDMTIIEAMQTSMETC